MTSEPCWVCPACAAAGFPAPLTLSHLEIGTTESPYEGVYLCSNPACYREFPLVRGLPFLLPNVPEYTAQQHDAILERPDFPPALRSALGDALGPDHPAESRRKQLSTYTHAHYADLDPHNTINPPPPGSFPAVVQTLLGMAYELPKEGYLLDAGCALGRGSFELATRFRDRHVFGVDYHAAMILAARDINTSGMVNYDRCEFGQVYTRVTYPLPPYDRHRTSFAAGDLLHPPLPPSSCAGILCANVIDSTPSPVALLKSLTSLLVPGGILWLTSPYEWTQRATPIAQWIGGHSQRANHQGNPHELLHSLLFSPTDKGGLGLTLLHNIDNIPWHLRLHQRGEMHYNLHAVIAKKNIIE